MLTIQNLSIQFGDKHLFKDVSARVSPRDRIGLVGVNGAGKSTLIKIMAGVRSVDEKVLSRAKSATVGYLPQELDGFAPGRTLYQEAESAFAEALALQEELEEVNRQLSTMTAAGPDCQALLQRQGELQDALESQDVFRIRSQVEKILVGLGFKEDEFEKDCHAFSGGWQMRLQLAKLLLARPALLLLDEPTNHLDLESLTWLEDFLQSYQGGLVMISHDRTFLNNICNSIWELSLGNLNAYKGNYDQYLRQKEERLEIQRAAWENQQANIQQTMRFVDRFRAKSTKASQVQSRLKQLDKMEKLELEESEAKVDFRFPPAPPSGRMTVEVRGLTKSYGSLQVFNGLDLLLQRGEKMAVVGVNGAGKSTLVKTMAGLLKADGGEIRFGHNVKVSYFGQHQAQDLDPELTVFDTVFQATPNLTVTQVRSLLGAFLFRGEDADKRVSVLSGGEKSRLALAKMIAVPANLLILDEPTNHLDMTSQEVLQEAMRRYDGAIIVVSHNRHFVNAFADKVLEIRQGRGTIYEGNIDEYLDKIRRDQEAALSAPPAGGKAQDRPGTGQPAGSKGKKTGAKGKTSGPAQAATPPKYAADNDQATGKNNGNGGNTADDQGRPRGKEVRRQQAQERQRLNQLLGPLRKKAVQAENEVEKQEQRKEELEKRLADPETYSRQEEFAELSKEYADLEHRLERLYDQWEKLNSEIEEITKGQA
ncbi:ABC-F family ATP-binding cassette domain-containing protein [Desulfurivibrio dismutans]|uniref:ABC-F family ATP-binding cassette domain-containing protein n=1 Tax=Desulfurivibrio dismutans TaxID=1398908 RepID=UPI0023DB0695|nr:ABC-F family ATP-binding cassette domain-containing protein [Desulfurivibrio alkaliphilus]MDF1614804.1 ABC-F family ATP-binding cassette domain-containing protein [Desulfurivibrio alkaliphilus]